MKIRKIQTNLGILEIWNYILWIQIIFKYILGQRYSNQMAVNLEIGINEYRVWHYQSGFIR